MGEASEAGKVERRLTWDDEECYFVSFGVGKARRYHAYMREWYKRLHDLSAACAAVAGSAAFVALLPEAPNRRLVQSLAFIVTVATVLDLVLNWGKKADEHDELNRRFTELAAKMHEWEPSEESRLRACAERLRIEADEPTERRLIDLWAHNDELRARGVRFGELVPLSRWQRLPIAYFLTFGLGRLEERMRARDEAAKASHASANSR